MNFEANKIYMIVEKPGDENGEIEENEEDGFDHYSFIQSLIDNSLQHFSSHRIIEEVYFEFYLYKEMTSMHLPNGRFDIFIPFMVLTDCKENDSEYQYVSILQTENGDSSMGFLQIKPLYMRPCGKTKYEIYELFV